MGGSSSKRRPETGFDSYDCFFPNQDMFPLGGSGNLIALPSTTPSNPITTHWRFSQSRLLSAKRSAGGRSLASAFPPSMKMNRSGGRRGGSALVLVHRQQLLDQWIDRLSSFLNTSPAAIGRIGGGCRKPGGVVHVALVQRLVRKGAVDDAFAEYGHLIVDECHHLSARSIEQVARRTKARFVGGLSATVTREDSHHPIIFGQCGPIRCQVDAKAQAVLRPFDHTVVVRPTGFRSVREQEPDKRMEFQSLYKGLRPG